MRFEGNQRGICRQDYEQFSKFLGLSQPKYQNNRSQVGCRESDATTQNHHLVGMVYGIKQSFQSIYEPEIALENGTIFEELNKPFYPTGCSKKNVEGCL